MTEPVVRPLPSDPLRLVGSIFERKYRIDRFVAEGGFGLVYAGRHLELGVPVALKVLRPALRAERDDWADLIFQFREEAIALMRLRRSNVVAVLDSGIAHIEDHLGGVPWMALEWLDGETLRDHLARRRNEDGVSPSACLALLRPVLEAIADAHDIGIAHRDIKPSNIMLVPTTGGVSPRVLDFGIAKMMAPDAETIPSTGETASDSATHVFTARSAAPEQLSGARTGPWTDVYALALLLTEVLTDKPPVTSEETNERYRDVFAEARPTPARVGIDVGAWEAVLARALSVRPADRHRNARELLGDLERALHASPDAVTGEPTSATARRPTLRAAPGARAPRGLRAVMRRGVLVAAVAGVAIASGVIGTRAWRAGNEPPSLMSAARPLVLVSPIHLQTDETGRRLARTFAELLSEQLRIGDAMRIPASDARQAILDASGLDAAAPQIPASVLARMHASAGADVVVAADLASDGRALVADITIYDAAGGASLGRISLHGDASDLNALVREGGARVRRGLGRPKLSLEDEAALQTSLPASADAALAYVEGLDARRAFRHRDAAARFEKAIELAPGFAPAHAALALALLRLGEQTRAREVADRAVELAASMSRSEELAATALRAETRDDWSAATESYRALVQFYPDRIDYVTSLARALVGVGNAAEAITVLDAAKQRPHSDWDLVRIDLVASFAHARRSEDAASLDDAREAEQIADRIGARVASADAVLAQAHAHRRAGRLDEAESLFLRAREVYVDVKDDDNILNCDAGSEEIAAMRGDYERAFALGERLIAAHKASGNAYRAAREMVSLCLIQAAAGHLTRARELCDEGGQLFIAAHDREGEGFRLVNLAELDRALGRLEGSADAIARGRALLVSVGLRAGIAYADAAAARLAAAHGDAATAEATFEIAYAEATAAGDAALLAEVALDRASLAFDRASPTEPLRFDDATKAVAAANDARLTALLDIHTARRASVAGDVTTARRFARSAEDRARASHTSDAMALALAMVLDAFPSGESAAPQGAPTLSPEEREARRIELASRVEELEAVGAAVAGLVSLSRASRGDDAVKLASRAVTIATKHGLVVVELVARHELARARGAAGGADATDAERKLAKLGWPGASRSGAPPRRHR